MKRVKKNIFVTEDEIENLCNDIVDEKVDLIYQNVFLIDGKRKILINEKLASAFQKTITKYEKKESEKNKEIINDYYKFINLIRELFEKLKLDNELETIILLKELINIGLFSANETFLPRLKCDEIWHFEGISVVNGSGCCRHLASFYQNIFRDLKHPTFLGGNLSEKKLKLMRKPIISNHAINLVNYHDQLLGYDISNEIVFSFINKNQLRDIFSKNSFFTYKSYWDLLHFNYSCEDINKNLDLFKRNVGAKISREEYEQVLLNVKKIIDANLKLFNMFFNYTYKLKNQIHEQILVKKLSK